ncbi:hypothetical protein PhCBS80983_g01394 [Powellomyces hirtus]|uniref:Pre-rRNA-processing protein TSR2 n=1 Tax=Powellomyces hirtus TaxID=109895 RepID=A0A507EB60_9FUNG|nr:hypothetical protein PhCBS80983_g01394 [Powellomyces hirtus]
MTSQASQIPPEIQAARWAGFRESIQYVLKGWTGLQIAIDAQMAGHYTAQTSQELFEHMSAFFQQYGLEVMPHEIAQNLEAYFDEVFHANLDDGSPNQIGEKLCRLYKEIMVDGRTETFEAVKATANRANGVAGASVRAGDDDSSDDDESSDEEIVGAEASSSSFSTEPMQVDAVPAEPRQRRPEPVVDEDGFEIVQKKGRRRN